MAVQQPNTGVVSRESEHQETCCGQHGHISARRVGEVQLVGASVGGSRLLAQDVEVMTVKVNRVRLCTRSVFLLRVSAAGSETYNADLRLDNKVNPLVGLVEDVDLLLRGPSVVVLDDLLQGCVSVSSEVDGGRDLTVWGRRKNSLGYSQCV